MAIYRTVHLSFWEDTKIVDEMTPEDKYFFLYLLTNPHTKLCGCYEVSKKQMSNECGYNIETIEKLLERHCNKLKIICYDNDTKEVLIFNWHKYNWTKSSDLLEGVRKDCEKIKNTEFKRYLEDILEGNERVYRPSPDGGGTSVTVTGTVSVTDNIPSTNNIKDKQRTKKDIVKHQYGEFKNVILTDEELLKLQERFTDIQERIENLSGYIASKGAVYKSHYATIIKWSLKDKPIQQTQPKKQVQKTKFSNFEQRKTSYSDIEDEYFDDFLKKEEK